MSLIPRTWVGWLILVLVVWFIVTMPATAGGDVGGIGHWISHAFNQFTIFIRSIR